MDAGEILGEDAGTAQQRDALVEEDAGHQQAAEQQRQRFDPAHGASLIAEPGADGEH